MFTRVRFLLAISQGIKRTKIWGRSYFGSETDLEWMRSVSSEIEYLAVNGYSWTNKDGVTRNYECTNAKLIIEMSKA